MCEGRGVCVCVCVERGGVCEGRGHVCVRGGGIKQVKIKLGGCLKLAFACIQQLNLVGGWLTV